MENRVRKGVIVIVINKNNEYLLLKQARDNSYSFISGGMEPGENHIETAIREAKEEAGITIDKNILIDTGEYIRFISGKGPGEQKVFLYDINDIKITVDNNEVNGYSWKNANDAQLLLENKPPLIKLIQIVSSEHKAHL